MKPVYEGLKGNQCLIIMYSPINFRVVEMLWLLLKLKVN